MDDRRFGLKLPLATPHVRLIEKLRRQAPVVIAIGVTDQPPRSPFSASEREAAVRNALGHPKGR